MHVRLWHGLVLLVVIGCHHEEGKNSAQNTGTSAPEVKATAQNDPRLDPVVQDMVNNTGVQLYPGALVDRARQPENRVSGTQHIYTVAMISKDSLKTVATFYENSLGQRYMGSVTTGRIDAFSPNNSQVSITFQQRSNGTAFLIDSSTPRPQPMQTAMPQPAPRAAVAQPQAQPQVEQQVQVTQQFSVNTTTPEPSPEQPNSGGG